MLLIVRLIGDNTNESPYGDNYIRERIMIDAQRVISLAEQQSALEHQGLKGRFRELLVDGLLEPWLPPTVKCATGTVVCFNNTYRNKTQDDILLIDQQISPAVLINSNVQEGVYLRNSVLARIEVKSSLNSQHITDYKDSCEQFQQLGLDLDNERIKANKIKIMEINILFAFKSTQSKKTTFSWFSSEKDGKFSVVCVPQHGLWKIVKIGNDMKWTEYLCQTPNEEVERLAAFVGTLSNTAFDQHLAAQGRDRLASLEGGIGQYFNHWELSETT